LTDVSIFAINYRFDIFAYLLKNVCAYTCLDMCIGVAQQVKAELCDVEDYCTEGLSEAEGRCDVEMQAEFLLCGVQIQISKGKPALSMLVVLSVRMFQRERVLAIHNTLHYIIAS